MCVTWRRLNLFLLMFLLSAHQVSAQQNHSVAHPDNRIYLDVVVSPKSGPPISNLQRQDFTILDNNVPQTIASFEAIDGRRARVSVFVVLDAVNIGSRVAAKALEEIMRFLKADGGRLALPTSLAILMSKGLEFEAGPSQDGNAIGAALRKHAIAIRSIGENADRNAGAFRFEVSFQAFAELLALERDRVGRKIIIWVSPGWPPLIAADYERDSNRKEAQQVRLQMFGNVIEIATQLREGRITVYGVDPSALGDLDPGVTTPPTNHLRRSESDVGIAGANKPSEVRARDLGLEVLAIQSGGLALHPGNDLASSLRKCIADATAIYEISFDPVITDQPNEYHHLEVQIAEPGLTARARQGYYSQPWPGAKFEAEAKRLGDTSQEPSIDDQDAADASSQVPYPEGRTYVDLPLEQLVKRIPDLKELQPAQDQKQLPMILERTGRSVDDFIHSIGDLIADEDVIQEKLNPDRKIKAKEHVQDDYLILHHGYEWGAGAEYRLDKKGNRLGAIGLEKGYLVTSGYALSCMSFSTVTQSQSKFRYLGDTKIDTRDAYALAFAQRPGEVTFTTVMRGTGAHEVDMLTQGILWVDKDNFQILRMRSDLLAPNEGIRLDQLTTDVTFGQVQLQDVPKPLWLPNHVDVYIEIGNGKFRNLHRYSNYRRYRVAVKIGTTQ
jgi:VWFA-related protein